VHRRARSEKFQHRQGVVGGVFQRCIAADGGNPKNICIRVSKEQRHRIVVTRIAVDDHSRRRARIAASHLKIQPFSSVVSS
jgi:hypothetical protein